MKKIYALSVAYLVNNEMSGPFALMGIHIMKNGLIHSTERLLIQGLLRIGRMVFAYVRISSIPLSPTTLIRAAPINARALANYKVEIGARWIKKLARQRVQVEEVCALAEECNRLFILYIIQNNILEALRIPRAQPQQRCIFWGMQMFAIFRAGISEPEHLHSALGCFLGAGC
jgi:hypothetical protein